VEEESISKGSATPLPQGAGASALRDFGNYPLFMHALFDAQPNFTWQHMYGGACFCGSIVFPSCRGLGPSAPNFGVPSVYA